LDENLEGVDAGFINMIHAEFVFEVVQEDIDRVMVAVEEVVIAGMLQIFPNASTENLVDAHARDNWSIRNKALQKK